MSIRHQAFSLIELVGVLAILAIITALVLPKFSHVAQQQTSRQLVNEAQITEAVIALQSLHAAINAHLTQYGCLACEKGTPLVFADFYDSFGQVLLSEGVIERPFQLSLSPSCRLRIRRISTLSANTELDGANGAYDLNGDGKNDVLGQFVIEAVLPDVLEPVARALKERMDGPQASPLRGRVLYRTPAPGAPTEVHVYLAHS